MELSCPEGEEGGHRLIRSVQPGDIVLHYSIPSRAFVGASVAKSEYKRKPISWNDYSNRDNPPYRKSKGWSLPLHNHVRFDEPIPLASIQTSKIKDSVYKWRAVLKRDLKRRRKAGETNINEHPFDSFRILYDRVFVANNYLSKLPADLLRYLPRLASLTKSLKTGKGKGKV
jgi:hypothetical protein